MSTSVVKRTGDPITFTWTYDPAHEAQIDEFRIESSPTPNGVFAVVVGGLPVSLREKVINAGAATLYFRIAAVKDGTNASYATNLTQVIIDNTPHPPENFSVS